jgi:hypothetical protein
MIQTVLMRRITTVAIGVLLFCAGAIQLQAATITVTNTNDTGPNSLRQALANANDGDTINFAVTGTIGLTSGELLVAKSVTISGPGTATLTVDGNATSRVFQIGPGKTVAISGLTLTNGSTDSENGGGILNDHAILTINSCAVQNSSAQSNRGGGIYNDGSAGSGALTILNSTVSGNYAYSAGGGIYNDAANGGSATLTIINSTVDGNSSIHGLPFHGGAGGGVYNDSSGGNAALTIRNSVVHGNYTSSAGGGIYNDAANGGSATLTIMNSTIDGNGAAYNDIPVGGGEGGGIYNDAGIGTITNSVVSNNGAGVNEEFPAGSGGGISNRGTMTIIESTIKNNGVFWIGGGIANSGTLTITGSTISGNRAEGEHDGQPFGRAGGVAGTVTFINSTLSDNFAPLGGGGFEGGGAIKNSTISGNGNGGISTNGIEIGNTILDGNTGANIDGTATSLGYNISSDDGGGNLTGPGDQINTAPLIGPLQDNGGPTLTHALLPGSPAIDAGDPNFSPPPFNDQRGCPFDRVFNGRIDIGSFETQPPRRPCPTPRSRSTPVPRAPPR